MVVRKKKDSLSHTHRYSIKNRPYCLGKSLRFEISIWETLPTVPGIPLSLLPLPNFPFPFRKPLPHFWMRETTPWGTTPPFASQDCYGKRRSLDFPSLLHIGKILIWHCFEGRGKKTEILFLVMTSFELIITCSGDFRTGSSSRN